MSFEVFKESVNGLFDIVNFIAKLRKNVVIDRIFGWKMIILFRMSHFRNICILYILYIIWIIIYGLLLFDNK